jgi:glycosyltransferase involved in cell wall biosynthesis
MPRLLIDATPVNAQAKGVGRYAYHVCLQLAARLPQDWSLHVLIHRGERNLFPTNFRGELIPMRELPEIVSGMFALKSQVRRLHADILLKTHESTGHVAGTPTVTICHDIDALIVEAQGVQRSLARRLIDGSKHSLRHHALKTSEFVICNSEFTRVGVEHYYKIPEVKTTVAYCAVDPRFYETSRTADKEGVCRKYGVLNYVLTFATGDPRENFKSLPAIAERLTQLGVATCLLVAGVKSGSSYATELRTQFRTRGLIEKKHFVFESFLGADRFDELAAIYTAADFYLELSLHEGFGMQLAEAMACGTTCITSPRGALAEVGDGHAIFIEPTDVENIAQTVKTAYENKLHLRDNQEQVRYTHKFSWDVMGKVVAEVLLNLANEHLERVA